MTCLFVNALVAVVPPLLQHVSLHAESAPSLICDVQAITATKVAVSCRIKSPLDQWHGVPQLRILRHEAAFACPHPLLRCCLPLVMHATRRTLTAGRHLADEASRSPEGESTAGLSALVFHTFAPVALRSFAAGSCWRLGSIPRRNLVGLDPQSKRFFAWQDCGCSMSGISARKVYGGTTAARARGMPARSGRQSPAGINPAVVMSPTTASNCPAPSSSTRRPEGAKIRRASATIAR
jgi:hypothetical protein